ncbi:hypothetical protein, partial [Tepidibacter sp. Z1-5]|uniref:hypothetical protein n=1 Tax=Tepidibacter sp. Z1-5 TaxID=3134138 RepID=UPI0030BBFDA4
INGVGNNLVAPKQNTTREQAIVMMSRIAKNNGWMGEIGEPIVDPPKHEETRGLSDMNIGDTKNVNSGVLDVTMVTNAYVIKPEKIEMVDGNQFNLKEDYSIKDVLCVTASNTKCLVGIKGDSVTRVFKKMNINVKEQAYVTLSEQEIKGYDYLATYSPSGKTLSVFKNPLK